MFDIGGFELLLIAVVGLLVIGPERLPETLRTLGLWLGRLRRSFTAVKTEIEKEIGMDEVKRQLHNEAVMDEMKRIEAQVKGSVDEARIDPGMVTGDIPAGVDDSHSPSPQSTQEVEQPPPETIPSEPEPVRPPTEAELEAAYERKQRANDSRSEDSA